MLALEHDDPGSRREMVGCGNAGNARAHDGEIEFLHGLTLQGLRRACNSWAA
jgi:hypothetical protein